MLIYSVKSGVIALNNKPIGIGYSGIGNGLNNSYMEDIRQIGPIPRGTWVMGEPHFSPHTGVYTMDLSPIGHTAFGRSLFRVHGDNRAMNHTASHGCIIAPRLVRSKMWNDNPDHMLKAV